MTTLRTLRTLAIALVALLVSVASAHAQTGACPTGAAVVVIDTGDVCVTPGVDYNTTHLGPDGVTQLPNVVRLDLLLFPPSVTDTATGTPSQVINLGKPTRNANGAVWTVVSALTSIPVGQLHKVRVVAVGQPLTAGGAAQVSARSPESNPFIRVGPPPAPLAPTAVAVPN